MRVVIIALIALLCFMSVASQVVVSEVECAGEVSCGGCIAAGRVCTWCKQTNYSGPRCEREDVLLNTGCSADQVYKGGVSKLDILQDEPFSDFVQDSDERRTVAVQVRPQKVAVALRPGGAGVNVTLKFQAARNYPLDVYYLMDLTWSMRDDKETLASLGGDLANTLRNLTENFQLGFGSFVDKPVMPFVDQARLSNPCSAERGVCSPAYGFRHSLRLSQNIQEFTAKVEDAPVSGNLDNTEGGLDALMQTVVCGQHIGWSEDSRKIVLMATDGIFHFAGDGKLGGAVRKNDGECHLDAESGLYTMTHMQDYPSLAEVDRVLQKHKMNVIFAVTRERLEHYTHASSVLEASSFVVILEEDSSNIIQLVRQGYQDIVSSLSFRDNSSSAVRVAYTNKCEGDVERQGGTCENVKQGPEYHFNLHISLDKCPENKEAWHERIEVAERGLSASLLLDVELLCGCECEYEAASQRCQGHGDFECGVCHCQEGWFGPKCSCTGRNATTLPELDKGCLSADAALQGEEVCFGQGDCVCGRCECHGETHGSYCECDDSRCEKWGAEGHRCGGPGRGRCVCGECVCEPGWGGDACTCATSTDTCVAPGDSKTCSGQGNCACGQCICGAAGETGGRYSGRYCEQCPTCRGLCELYRPCVLCKAFNHSCAPQPNVDYCLTNTGHAKIELVNQIQVQEGEELCVFRDPIDGCQFRFTYKLDTLRSARLKVSEERVCAPPINTAMFAGAIIVLVVLAGLAMLLIWRVGVAAKDRIAYQRFKKDSQMTTFLAGENPLFKPATTYYTMPQGYMGAQEPPNSPALTITSPSSPTATTPM